MIKLTLSPEYAEAILQVLGQLPTQTNAYPIYQEVKRQYEAQANSDTVPTGEDGNSDQAVRTLEPSTAKPRKKND